MPLIRHGGPLLWRTLAMAGRSRYVHFSFEMLSSDIWCIMRFHALTIEQYTLSNDDDDSVEI